MLTFFTCGRAFGQQPTRKAVNLTSTALSLRSRLGSGFAWASLLGWPLLTMRLTLTARSRDDSGTFSRRRLLLGRVPDKRPRGTNVTRMNDRFDRNCRRSRWPALGD